MNNRLLFEPLHDIIPQCLSKKVGVFCLLNGTLLKDAIISGANNICNNKESVNDMNIFPVPDGDTGTNMSMTICSAAKELADFESDNIAEVAKKAAQLMLRGARGNSGVILSLLFKGFAKGLDALKEADGNALMQALGMGVDAAYKSVANPAEGTILTVARVAFEQGSIYVKNNNDAKSVWMAVCTGAKEALASTPEHLPVLKKAGVVDAGGQGLVHIFEGMKTVICGGNIVEKDDSPTNEYTKTKELGDNFFKSAAAQFDADIRYTYCTEFIASKKSDVSFDSDKFSTQLQTMGDCVVVVDDDDIIKTHVHTENPGIVLQEALMYGELLNVKIENMKEQHKKAKTDAENAKKAKLTPQEPTEEYGFVAVAAGDGLDTLFNDLGVNHIVSGGQTMNPSTDDICEAVKATPAKHVFVMPNNKNILLAAQQSAKIIDDRTIIVIPSKNIPQGIAAMLAFDPDLSQTQNEKDMNEAMKNVASAQVTFAARKAEYGGFKIKKGDILALKDGKLTYVEKDINKAALKITRSLVNNKTSFVTIIWGEGVSSAQAEECYNMIKAKINKDIDITLVYGGQPIYHYLISVE